MWGITREKKRIIKLNRHWRLSGNVEKEIEKFRETKGEELRIERWRVFCNAQEKKTVKVQRLKLWTTKEKLNYNLKSFEKKGMNWFNKI